MENRPFSQPDDHSFEPFVFDGEIVDVDTREQLFADMYELLDRTAEQERLAEEATTASAISAWRQHVLQNTEAPEHLKTVALHAPDAAVEKFLRQSGAFE